MTMMKMRRTRNDGAIHRKEHARRGAARKRGMGRNINIMVLKKGKQTNDKFNSLKTHTRSFPHQKDQSNGDMNDDTHLLPLSVHRQSQQEMTLEPDAPRNHTKNKKKSKDGGVTQDIRLTHRIYNSKEMRETE